MERVEYKEVIELFLIDVIYKIKNERDVPAINFVFNDDGIKLFNEVKENPFQGENFWCPDIRDENIEYVQEYMDDRFTFYIDDAPEFFHLLTDIVNESLKLNADYKDTKSSRSHAMLLMRRIWLRMGIEDINDVYGFLRKQLEFFKNRTFDCDDYNVVDHFKDYEVKMKTACNLNWDESTRSMLFSIVKDNEVYALPHILYDIDSNNFCYIYAIQGDKDKIKSKKIERLLYNINKGIDEPNVHPSKVYSLLYFFKELKKKGIKTIIVPSMQVFSYDYHIILADRAKDDLLNNLHLMSDFPDEKSIEERYLSAKEWYDRVYGKEDKISQLKTEELINLMYRILEHDEDVSITNEFNIEGDYLKMRIR